MLVDVLRVLPSAYLLSSVTQKLIRENHILWSFSFLGWVRPKVTEDGRHWSQSTRIHSRRTNIYGLWGLRARLRRLLLGRDIVHVQRNTAWNWWPLPVLLILSMSALGSCILTCHVGFLEAGFAVLQILLSKSRKSECLWASDFRGKINRFSLILNRQPCASYTFIVHLNVTSGCSTVARIELLPYEVRWSAVNMYSTRLTLITSKV